MKESVAVTFNIIVPRDVWLWDDKTTKMHLRFGDSALGNWTDYGEFKPHK